MAQNPEYGPDDIAKELGKIWTGLESSTEPTSKYLDMAAQDMKRYEVVSKHSVAYSCISFDAYWIARKLFLFQRRIKYCAMDRTLGFISCLRFQERTFSLIERITDTPPLNLLFCAAL